MREVVQYGLISAQSPMACFGDASPVTAAAAGLSPLPLSAMPLRDLDRGKPAFPWSPLRFSCFPLSSLLPWSGFWLSCFGVSAGWSGFGLSAGLSGFGLSALLSGFGLSAAGNTLGVEGATEPGPATAELFGCGLCTPSGVVGCIPFIAVCCGREDAGVALAASGGVLGCDGPPGRASGTFSALALARAGVGGAVVLGVIADAEEGGGPPPEPNEVMLAACKARCQHP